VAFIGSPTSCASATAWFLTTMLPLGRAVKNVGSQVPMAGRPMGLRRSVRNLLATVA